MENINFAGEKEEESQSKGVRVKYYNGQRLEEFFTPKQ